MFEQAKKFALGSIVEWESQAAGVIKKKVGKVVEIVAPGELPKTPVRHTDNSRSYESYVVRVEGGSGRRVVNYWPRPMNLSLSMSQTVNSPAMPKNDMFWLMHRTAGSSLVDSNMDIDASKLDGYGVSDRALICAVAIRFFGLDGFSDSEKEQIMAWSQPAQTGDKEALAGVVRGRLERCLAESR